MWRERGAVHFFLNGASNLQIVGIGSAKMTMSRNVFIEDVKKFTFVMFQHPYDC